jgi:hypothetical protein
MLLNPFRGELSGLMGIIPLPADSFRRIFRVFWQGDFSISIPPSVLAISVGGKFRSTSAAKFLHRGAPHRVC